MLRPSQWALLRHSLSHPDTPRRVITAVTLILIILKLTKTQSPSPLKRTQSDLTVPLKPNRKTLSWDKLKHILPILFHKKEICMVIVHTLFLIARTWMSLIVAKLDGRLVKDLVMLYITLLALLESDKQMKAEYHQKLTTLAR